ncbi:MAG TPA: VOC family protein [Terriglobales bacterium]|nr:VOC family protein [Terriglobales bacterium]
MPVRAIPQGYHTATPHLVVRGAAQAIEFYKKALGAEELMRMAGPDGKIGHAEIKIGDSIIFLADEFPGMPTYKAPQTLGGCTGGIMLYVEDVDKAYKRAVDSGANVSQPLQDMFWGDRYGAVIDPFGHVWSLATHKEDVSPAEMEKRSTAYAADMAKRMAQKKTA